MRTTTAASKRCRSFQSRRPSRTAREEKHMQVTERPTEQETQKDFLPLNGTDHVEFYVGNAKQAAYYYRAAFGMKLIAYSGPETGMRDRVSYVLEQGKIRFILTTPLGPDNAIAEHIRLHGDGVREIALEVEDAESAY